MISPESSVPTSNNRDKQTERKENSDPIRAAFIDALSRVAEQVQGEHWWQDTTDEGNIVISERIGNIWLEEIQKIEETYGQLDGAFLIALSEELNKVNITDNNSHTASMVLMAAGYIKRSRGM